MAGSAEIVGAVTPEAAALTGLAAGTPVAAGLHDVTASALGIGGHAEGVLGDRRRHLLDQRGRLVRAAHRSALVLPQRRRRRAMEQHGDLAGLRRQLRLVPRHPLPPRPLRRRERRTVDPRPARGRDRRGAGAALQRALPPLPLRLAARRRSPAPAFSDCAAGTIAATLLRAVLEGIAFNHRVHVDALRDGFTVREAPADRRRLAQPGLRADVRRHPRDARHRHRDRRGRGLGRRALRRSRRRHLRLRHRTTRATSPASAGPMRPMRPAAPPTPSATACSAGSPTRWRRSGRRSTGSPPHRAG